MPIIERLTKLFYTLYEFFDSFFIAFGNFEKKEIFLVLPLDKALLDGQKPAFSLG